MDGMDMSPRRSGARAMSTSKWQVARCVRADPQLRSPNATDERRSAISATDDNRGRRSATKPIEDQKADRNRERDADLAEVDNRLVAVVHPVQEHHREQQHEHDQRDRTQNRMSTSALQSAAKLDHKRKRLQHFAC